jgi:hypothetical protein
MVPLNPGGAVDGGSPADLNALKAMDRIRAKTVMEATDASLQLRARGISWWTVAEGKEEIGRNVSRRIVGNPGCCDLRNIDRDQRNPGSGQTDR